jgi:hypothetical protein
MREPVLVKARSAIADSPARLLPPTRGPFRIGAVQERWHADPDEHEAALRAGIAIAAREGARLVCLQELTLSPYFAVRSDAHEYAQTRLETIPDGPTCDFARRAAGEFRVHVQASLHGADAVWLSDLLGPVVPRAGAHLRAGGSRRDRLSDGHRL